MIKDKGIRGLIPGVVLPSEQKEKQEAREYIRRKIGVRKELPAAPTLISDYLHPTVTLKLPAETKDEFGYTPSQNKEIEKQLTRPTPPPGLWKNFVKYSKETNDPAIAANKALIESRRQQQLKRSWGLDKEKQKQKEHYKKMVDFGIDNSSVKFTGSRQHLYDDWDKPEKKNPPISPTLFQDALPGKNIKNFQKNNLKSAVIIDSKHPDGFRLAEDNDLYKNYSDTPVRYVQEMKYKYKDGGVPTDSVVKTFDGADASTFPSDPMQKKALAKYQLMYDKLSPLQKKQLETTQKLKKK